MSSLADSTSENDHHCQENDATNSARLSLYKKKEIIVSDVEGSAIFRASSSRHSGEQSEENYPESSGRSAGHKQLLQARDKEMEQLNKRLQVLEEEAAMLKRELFNDIEERKALMNEVHYQFKTAINVQAREDFNKTVRMINAAYKDGKIGSGLPQILSQGSNHSLVIGDMRTNTTSQYEEARNLDYAEAPNR